MSWSVLGIFVLLVTWGYTESILLGTALLLACIGAEAAWLTVRARRSRRVSKVDAPHLSRQQFLAAELERIQSLRESGLLTEDELSVQNRLLSCKSPSSSS